MTLTLCYPFVRDGSHAHIILVCVVFYFVSLIGYLVCLSHWNFVTVKTCTPANDEVCFTRMYIGRLCDGPQLSARASNFKPDAPGFHPLAGQGEGHFFLSLRVNFCADLFVSDPPPPSPPSPSLTASGMVTQKYCMH